MKIESCLVEPRLIVVVGTEEDQQSKLAEQLAQIYAFHYLDANDLMSKGIIACHNSGRAFTESMREPWLLNILRLLSIGHKQGQSYILSQSGMRRMNRKRFRRLGYAGESTSASIQQSETERSNILFLLLHDDSLIQPKRSRNRTNYFMPAGAQDQSLSIIDLPIDENDTKVIDLASLKSQSLNSDDFMYQLVQEAVREIDSYFSLSTFADTKKSSAHG